MILTLKRGLELFELEVDSQDQWDSLPAVEKNRLLDEAAAESKKQSHEEALLNTDLIGKNIQFQKPSGTAAILKAAPTEKTKKGDNVSDQDKNQSEPNREQAVEKMAVEFMKGTSIAVEKYLDFFNSGLEVFKAANPGKGINDFVDTDTGFELKQAYEKQRATMLTGPLEAFTAPLEAEAKTVTTDIAKQVEAFSVSHNLDPNVARDRLRTISPTFQALEKRLGEIPAERHHQVAKAAQIAKRWCDARSAEIHKAETDEVTKAAESRRRATMTPSERKFDDRVTDIMKSHKLERPAATNWAIDNDAVAKSLYEVTREERASGVRP